MPSFAVILPAAGKSSRFGGPIKKPFLSLEGRHIWLRTAEMFVGRPDVKQTLVVVSPEDRDEFVDKFAGNLTFLDIELVTGGSERFGSVANALDRVRDEIDFVAVHDAVRPLVSEKLIDAVFTAAGEHGAALPGTPLADTLKRVDADMRVTETPPREGLWLAQTPQVARREWLVEAYRRRGELGEAITDDAQLVAAIGHPVHIVPGEITNLKITTQGDLKLAEAILGQRNAPPPEPKSRHPFDDEWD